MDWQQWFAFAGSAISLLVMALAAVLWAIFNRAVDDTDGLSKELGRHREALDAHKLDVAQNYARSSVVSAQFADLSNKVDNVKSTVNQIAVDVARIAGKQDAD